ncbi:MAG: hypothetical protein H7A23_16820 [Leptospiraceae bacterium]|nr:hypothetical protein [Leptospiraceae bacterium]MCP5496210.1 hypothetical protein [Leptospiraceae bacterium]
MRKLIELFKLPTCLIFLLFYNCLNNPLEPIDESSREQKEKEKAKKVRPYCYIIIAANTECEKPGSNFYCKDTYAYCLVICGLAQIPGIMVCK